MNEGPMGIFQIEEPISPRKQGFSMQLVGSLDSQSGDCHLGRVVGVRWSIRGRFRLHLNKIFLEFLLAKMHAKQVHFFKHIMSTHNQTKRAKIGFSSTVRR